MSESHPMDGYRDRCNKMCNTIWKDMDELSKHIDTLPEGQSRKYLEQYRFTLGMLAELYFFHAVSLGQIRDMEAGVIQALFKEVFKDRTIQLPYEPEKGTTLRETMERYKEKEPAVNWMDRGLKDKAKDVEKNNE
jgi:hypothetical protein